MIKEHAVYFVDFFNGLISLGPANLSAGKTLFTPKSCKDPFTSIEVSQTPYCL
jgi:hypothetical protein